MKCIHLSRITLAGPCLSLLVTALALSACATAPTGSGGAASPAQSIEAARTPAEHEALARYFDDQAAQARARAEEHRGLRSAYEHGTQYRWIPGVGARTGMPAMPRHCEQLIRIDDEAARTYSEMAEQHRQWATPEAQ